MTSAQIALGDGGTIDIVNYVRLRDGRIERLSGFSDLIALAAVFGSNPGGVHFVAVEQRGHGAE